MKACDSKDAVYTFRETCGHKSPLQYMWLLSVMGSHMAAKMAFCYESSLAYFALESSAIRTVVTFLHDMKMTNDFRIVFRTCRTVKNIHVKLNIM